MGTCNTDGAAVPATPIDQSELVKLFDRPHTFGELFDAIVAIDNPNVAKAFYEAYVAYIRRQPHDEPPEDVARQNIGWVFGEGVLTKSQKHMWRALGAYRPVFD